MGRQWGLTANNVANSVLWGSVYVNKTANSTNQTDLSGNVTVGAWVNGTENLMFQRGVVGVSAGTLNARATNASSEGNRITHTGWQLRTVGTGPVTGATITNGGSSYVNAAVFQFTATGTGTINAVGTVTTNSTGGITALAYDTNPAGDGFVSVANATFVAPVNAIANSTSGATLAVSAAGAGYTNGDIVTFSNGQANALGTITTTASGNISTIAITRAGRGFSNTLNTVLSYANSSGGRTGNAIVSVTVTAGGTAYTNGDIATFSNGVVNATGSITTNSIGGITTVTMSAVGRGFANVTSIVVGIANSTGGATLGSTAVLTPVLYTTTVTFTVTVGSGATATATLGGRAGRVHYETLVALKGITGPAVASANNTYLPSS